MHTVQRRTEAGPVITTTVLTLVHAILKRYYLYLRVSCLQMCVGNHKVKKKFRYHRVCHGVRECAKGEIEGKKHF